MGVVDRIRNILVTPATEWPVIALEETTVAALYRDYILWLAAIPVVARLIGGSVFGYYLPGVGTRFPPLGRSAVEAIIAYGISLAALYLIALMVSWISPMFLGKKDDLNALKLTAYSATPVWLGGLFGLVPTLSLLQLVASLYGFYLFYIGLPVLMRCPVEKAPIMSAAVILVALILWFVMIRLFV
jgi:hypothetical protein